ncbi:hypothetical protein ACEWY4_021159 [Coilia grayii]|uniref:G-protein coupled receptors family 1 profile domain-containing protein n=1 Tax=Coilia grayii TaxID=363190 RepID=A0ABD1J9I4_9TELE
MERFHGKTLEFFNVTDISDLYFFMSIHSWVILPIAVPMVCLAICGLVSLIKTGQVAPVYIINLLISDMLQMFTRPVVLSLSPSGVIYELTAFVYSSGLLASTFFMVCIAGERYAMIAHPVWYRIHRTVKKSLLCSVAVWLVTAVAIGGIVLAAVTDVIEVDKVYAYWAVVTLLPYPFVIFFSVGTWRALSKSMSIPPREQRRIMGMLALVLIIYTALFLPYIALLLLMSTCPALFTDYTFQCLAVVSTALLSLNLVVDPVLYVFMGKRSSLALPCCRCRRRSHQERAGQEITEFSPHLATTISAGETRT